MAIEPVLTAAKSQQEVSPPSPSPSPSSPALPQPPHLHQDICKSSLRIHLLVISFGTGLLDAASYADFGIFASNQTGNTIILLTEAIASTRIAGDASALATSGAPLLTVGISLAAFLFFGAIFGQVGNVVGRCKRVWLAISTLAQAIFLLVTAVLLQTRILTVGSEADTAETMQGIYRSIDVDGALVIFMLASASGIQVSMAKSVGVPECPSAMLTSPFADLVTDPDLFRLSLFSPRVFSRNIRVLYILSLSAGTVIGAALYFYADTIAVVWVAFGLRLGNLAHIFLARAVTVAEGKSDDSQQGERPTLSGGEDK